jgi:hypothetical protein
MAVLFFLAGSLAQGRQPSTDELLQNIRQRVQENLKRLPNYICRQTIERSLRSPGSKKAKPLDTLQLEVALIGNRELYSWGGAKKFEEKALEEIVGRAGAIGTGSFGIHLTNIFVDTAAEFTYRGEEQLEGRSVLRFDFRVPRARSNYHISDGKNTTTVAYRGSFLVAGGSLDLIHVETYVDQVPPPVQITKASDRIEYSRVRIGEQEFLLPRTAELSMASPTGEGLNRSRFESCRQYIGESVLSFSDAPTPAEPPKAPRVVELPAGLALELNLRTPILAGKTAVGEPVTAAVSRAVRGKDGTVLLPKGALLTGNVTRLEHRKTRGFEYSVIGLMFESAEAEGVRAGFAGTLEEAGVANGSGAYHVPFTAGPVTQFDIWTDFRDETLPPRPNEGVFYVRGDMLRIQGGFRLVWRTR